MSAPKDQQGARELVRSIAKKHGYLAAEKFARIPDPELRREFEEAFLNKDLIIGSSVITLAKNLYSSKARFVFELLQNADDNRYKRARSLQQTPSVSFMLYHDRIVVDCNEDGFTESNLTAICTVGASSKTGPQGYIGEKGIGFKSVFMVAWKIHIQSGGLSFSFTHNRGDSGMGMISPVWEDATEVLTSPLTRMTLYLHREAREDGILKESIRRQFSDIQETFLLFMKNLEQVSVRFHDGSGRETSCTSYGFRYQGEPVSNRAELTKTTVVHNKTTKASKLFHLCTYQATNLAKNENRTYSDQEHSSRAWSTSQIVLAFPLTDNEIPIVEPQKLFVFMPVAFVGMNFIIQADFVTDANRQSVVADSPRNHDLIDEIAKAYVKAVLQFCEHPTLQYQWMRYLPKRDHQDRGRLWASLVDRIAMRLAQTPVVLSHKSNSLRLMSQLYNLVTTTLDANGQPLFEDVFPETMLSRRYTPSDIDTLLDYGVPKVSWTQVLIWLRDDLCHGAHSRIRSSVMSDDWHTRTAKLLAQPFDGLDHVAEELMGIAMVPLSDGSWVSVSSSFPVYFPVIDDLEIPSRVQLQIVDKSITNSARLALFKHLGVRSATVDLVRRWIIRDYPDSIRNMTVTLEESKQHIDFMIKTQHLANSRETGLERLAVYTTRRTLVFPAWNLYLKTDDPLGPWELLRRTDPGPEPGDGAPRLDRNFLHPIYLQNTSDEPERAEEWCQWLHEKLQVQLVLGFEGPAFLPGALSEEAEYLQKHRPEKFLGALQRWFEKSKKPMKPELIENLRSTKVLCRAKHMVPLKETYFPTEGLETRVERYVEDTALFPWLWLGPDTATRETVPRKWKALIDVLKIGNSLSDLEVALDMFRVSLRSLQYGNGPMSLSREELKRLLGLYGHVWSMFQEHTDRAAGEKLIRSVFFDDRMRPIFVPAMPGEDDSTWTFAEDCVWSAPRLLMTRTVISIMWGRFFPRDISFQHLEHFFTKVVGVPKCSYSTYVDELRYMRDEVSDDIDAIRTWYEELNKCQRSSSRSLNEGLKKAFEEERLIYAPSAQGSSWHKVSQCVWSTASRLRGKPSLNDEYEHLHGFFVEFLGVKPVDLDMAVNELREAADEGSSVDMIRDSIWTVNSLLNVSAVWPGSKQVTQARIFPVRLPSGEVRCLSKGSEFFVIDREPYRTAFERHVKLLNFTLADVAELGPFLQWTRLEDRYLSNCVKEVTSFGGGYARVVSDNQRQICNRAHALLRIAKQYGSPYMRDRSAQGSFYELLHNTQILGTDGVSSDIQLQQDGRTYTERGKPNAVFIRQDGSQLKVYVPQRKKEQTQAFKIKLPRRFLEWMMTDPDTQLREAISDKGITATEHVFNALGSMLEETLEEDGIATIDIENRDDPPDDDTEADSTADADEDRTLVDHADYVAVARSQDLLTQWENGPRYLEDDEDVFGFSVDGVLTPSTVATSSTWRAANASNRPITVPLRTRQSLTSQTPTLSPITSPRMPSDDTQYSNLLDYVVRVARAAAIPQWSEHGHAGLGLARNNSPMRISASTQFERNCKVGAAGELFVFELLSNLGRQHESLPGFTRSNWKSNVRKFARAHHEYADLEPWDGVETSDIVYSDESGILTSLLREKGYFEDLWDPSMNKPNYFVEVKTTTSDCGASFYMNRAQYALMQNSTLVPWTTNLYVIFRIYNLGQDNMGLQIYLDPERLRQQDKLVFTGERWSVTPGSA